MKNDLVWYACYGSNLLNDRFLCYITGGRPKGSSKTYEGCSDKSLPVDNEEIIITSELYFARNSGSWNNAGVAFIRTHFEAEQQTLGRMYLINRTQLTDVARQETATRGQLVLDFDTAIVNGSSIFKRPSYYGNLIYLGNHVGFPIFSLTNESDFQTISKPCESYLNVIIEGLRETYDHLTSADIAEYLISKKGVKEYYDRQSLTTIIDK